MAMLNNQMVVPEEKPPVTQFQAYRNIRNCEIEETTPFGGRTHLLLALLMLFVSFHVNRIKHIKHHKTSYPLVI
jgi:hypothetical protein